jgi:PAS domain S-box-containing protein
MIEGWTETDFVRTLIGTVLANAPNGSVYIFNRDFQLLCSQGSPIAANDRNHGAGGGRRLWDVLPVNFVTLLDPYFDRAFNGEHINFDLPFEGHSFSASVAPLEFVRDRVSTIVVVLYDVTEIRAEKRRLRLLDEVGDALASSLDIDAALTDVAQLVVPAVADWCAIHLVGEQGEVVPVAMQYANSSNDELDGNSGRNDPRDVVAVDPARVVRTGKSEFYAASTEDMIAASAVDERDLSVFRSGGVTSGMTVPMSVRGRAVGTITLSIFEANPVSIREVFVLATGLAQRIALAVDDAHLYQMAWQELSRREQAEEGERLRRIALDRLAHSDVIGIITVEREWIVEANDIFLRMVGYEEQDLVFGGLNWWEFTPPEYRPVTLEALAELLATGSSTPFEKELIRRDGSRVPVLMGKVLIHRDPLRWVSFVVDLSARRAFEDAQQTFMEDIGHDLKSPISVTRWTAQLMRRRIRDGELETESLDRGLGTIENSTMRMASLVNGLMDAARLRLGQTLELNLQPTDLVELVERSVESHRHATDRHSITTRESMPALTGMWDRERLERVIDNLISNAIKFSPDGGDLVVSIAREGRNDGDWAIVSVRDQGVGISEEVLPTIFNRFRRGSNAAAEAPGSGIGLAGSRQIVEQHGGTIGVESHVGEGSTFTVRLPMEARSPAD